MNARRHPVKIRRRLKMSRNYRWARLVASGRAIANSYPRRYRSIIWKSLAAVLFAAKYPAGCQRDGFRGGKICPAASALQHGFRWDRPGQVLRLAGARTGLHRCFFAAHYPCHGQRTDYKPDQEFHASPRCKTTSSTNRLPTYASNKVAKPLRVKLRAVLPRQPRQRRPTSSRPNMNHESMVKMVL